MIAPFPYRVLPAYFDARGHRFLAIALGVGLRPAEGRYGLLHTVDSKGGDKFMPDWLAFGTLGVAQLAIWLVLRRFARHAVVGRPSPLVRFIVTLAGLIAVAFFCGAVYFGVMGT